MDIGRLLSDHKIQRVDTAVRQGLSIEEIETEIAKLTGYRENLALLRKRLSGTQNQTLRSGLWFEGRDAAVAIAWYEDILSNAKDYAAWVRERSELGQRFNNRTFGTLDARMDSKALAACKAYAENFDIVGRYDKHNSIILSGSVGIGKTHLAAAVANYLIDSKNVVVCFGSIVELLDKVRGEMQMGRDLTKYNMKRSPLLVIDDLGKEKPSEWTNQTLYEVINSRYESQSPMIITTNLSIRELSARYDNSVVSRLTEMSRVINMTGDDRRKE